MFVKFPAREKVFIVANMVDSNTDIKMISKVAYIDYIFYRTKMFDKSLKSRMSIDDYYKNSKIAKFYFRGEQHYPQWKNFTNLIKARIKNEK